MPDQITTRKRTLVKKYRQVHKRTSNQGVVTFPINREVVFSGTQITTSEGHPWPPPKKGGLKDLGGDFETSKTEFGSSTNLTLNASVPTFFQGQFRGNTVHLYTGPIFPTNPTNIAFPPNVTQSSNDDLDEYGATAIARCKPTNSIADASTFLGELVKEGLPSLIGAKTWKDRTTSAKNAGDEYLNYQFGWQPIVSEVKKFSEAVRKADTVMKQYERDAGKVVRRTYDFPSNRTVVETNLGSVGDPYGPIDSAFFDLTLPFGELIRTRETVQRRWFSGAFTYHLPTGYDSRKAMDRYALLAEKVFGVSLTPEVLWNLSPWSWAVDWFSNTGDVVSNLSDWASDGLVMRYGYIMEHTRVSDIYTMTRNRLKGTPVISPMIFVTETKTRRKANPFGFGLSFDGLSPSQLSIIAALGLSRGR